MEAYFDWKGQRSLEFGVIVSSYPPISHPSERVKEVVVPGRSGSLHQLESDIPVYDAYIKSVECYLLPEADQEDVFTWLAGAGDLVLGNEPARAYKARVAAPIELRKIVRGRAHRSFTLSFTVQPIKYLHPAAAEVKITTSGASLTHPGNAPAHPLIQVEGSGDISLSVGGDVVQINALAGGVVLDWEAMITTDLDGHNLPSGKLLGGPQRLYPGQNLVSWTGSVSKVTITPRWAFV